MQTLFLLTVPLLAAPSYPAPGDLDEAVRAFGEGRYPRVTELAAAAAKGDADRPRLEYLAGEAWLVLGDAIEAEKAFRDVLVARPEAIPAQVGLGRALTALQRHEEALSVLDAVLAKAPADVQARIAHGLVLSLSGAEERAIADLDQAWKAAPGSPEAARGYVEVLLRAGKVPAAAAVVEALQEERPGHPMGPFLLGWVMERDGEDGGAIEQYELAVELDPGFLDAHKNLAILCHTLSNTYRDKERTERAFAHYERYFALGGRDPGLRQMHANLLEFKDQILGL
jgi:tetratricopeptide (TPR) repeat protein